MKLQHYTIHIEPLPREEGGGFLVTVPDLPGCVADRETVDAAIAEAHDAFKAWAAAEQQDKGNVCRHQRPTAAASSCSAFPRARIRDSRHAPQRGRELETQFADWLPEGGQLCNPSTSSVVIVT